MNGYFDKEFLGEYDLISVAGGAKGIVEREDYLFNQMAISCRLHSPENIVLIQHEDCGAYGGTSELGEREEDFQREQLSKAEENIKQARLQLIAAVKQVLENGLNLLEIEAPAEM